MSNYHGGREVVYVHKESNTLGTAAFVLSLVAFVSIGCLSPVSLVLSIMAMQKQPKDLAVAGLVLSLIGCIPAAFVLFWVLALVGVVGAAGAVGTAGAVGSAVGGAVAGDSASAPQLEPGAIVIATNVKVSRSDTGRTLKMQIKNVSSDTLTKVAFDVELVSDGRTVARDSIITTMKPMAPNETRLVEIDVPKSSPLNGPSFSTAKVKVRKTGGDQYDEPADRRGK